MIQCPMCKGSDCGRCEDGLMSVDRALELQRSIYAPKRRRGPYNISDEPEPREFDGDGIVECEACGTSRTEVTIDADRVIVTCVCGNNRRYERSKTHTERRKLTDEDVRDIRRLAGGTTYRELATRFDVAPSTIGQIIRGEIRSNA